MIKAVIRKQYTNDTIEAHYQTFEFDGNYQVGANLDATWEQVLEVSDRALDTGLEMTMETNLLDGGQVFIDTWQ